MSKHRLWVAAFCVENLFWPFHGPFLSNLGLVSRFSYYIIHFPSAWHIIFTTNYFQQILVDHFQICNEIMYSILHTFPTQAKFSQTFHKHISMKFAFANFLFLARQFFFFLGFLVSRAVYAQSLSNWAQSLLLTEYCSERWRRPCILSCWTMAGQKRFLALVLCCLRRTVWPIWVM